MAGLLLRRDPFYASGLPVSLALAFVHASRRCAELIFLGYRDEFTQRVKVGRVCFIAVDEVPLLILLSVPGSPRGLR
jgi:hypothetical protein